MLARILGYLGVGDLCTFQPTGAIYEAHFPDATVTAGRRPRGLRRTGSPGRSGITDQARSTRFLDLCRDACTTRRHALPPALSLKELEEAVEALPDALQVPRRDAPATYSTSIVPDDRLEGRARRALAAVRAAAVGAVVLHRDDAADDVRRAGRLPGRGQHAERSWTRWSRRSSGRRRARCGARGRADPDRGRPRRGRRLADGDASSAPRSSSPTPTPAARSPTSSAPEHLPAPFLKQARPECARRSRPSCSSPPPTSICSGRPRPHDVRSTSTGRTTRPRRHPRRPPRRHVADASRRRSDPALAPPGEHVLVVTCTGQPGMPAAATPTSTTCSTSTKA